jgi:hypothetical protein
VSVVVPASTAYAVVGVSRANHAFSIHRALLADAWVAQCAPMGAGACPRDGVWPLSRAR